MNPDMIPCQEDGMLPCQESHSPWLDIPIEEYFRYHAPDTEERKAKHKAINDSALALGLALEATVKAMDDLMHTVQKNVDDPNCLIHAFEASDDLRKLLRHKRYLFIVQQIRMFANQGVTIDALRDKIEKDSARLKIEVKPTVD